MSRKTDYLSRIKPALSGYLNELSELEKTASFNALQADVRAGALSKEVEEAKAQAEICKDEQRKVMALRDKVILINQIVDSLSDPDDAGLVCIRKLHLQHLLENGKRVADTLDNHEDPTFDDVVNLQNSLNLVKQYISL
jgi:hypothetical protein